MFAIAGATATDATGTRLTVTAALPVLPSLVAVIVTAPAATPVTVPAPDTAATPGALETQVIARPERTFPAASVVVAASRTLAPTNTVAVVGLIATAATGTFATVTAAVALFPSLVALRVALPAETPVQRPLPDTVATLPLELVQTTERLVNAFPAESLGVAVNWMLRPATTLAVVGLNVTDATGTFDTVTVELPFCPSLVAVMVAVPTATPVTLPVPLTVATEASLDAHVIVRPLIGFPFTSLRVAASCAMVPT